LGCREGRAGRRLESDDPSNQSGLFAVVPATFLNAEMRRGPAFNTVVRNSRGLTQDSRSRIKSFDGLYVGRLKGKNLVCARSGERIIANPSQRVPDVSANPEIGESLAELMPREGVQ